MADPGTILSVASLTFQVFSGCVKGYELLTDAKHMPSECQYLRVRLKTEQYRLLDWADVIQLDETDDRLLISNTSKGLLVDVLDQQRRLLHQFGRLDDKYKRLSKPLLVDLVEDEGSNHLITSPSNVPDDDALNLVRVGSDFQRRFPRTETLLNKSLTWAKMSREYPRKLKWATFDKEKMEVLILKLSSFNDFMREMLNHSQLQSLATKQTRTEFQIMQLNSSIQNLVELIGSTAWEQNKRSNPGHPTNPVLAFLQARGLSERSDQSAHTAEPAMQSLASLAQVKALNSAIDDPTIFTDDFTSSIALTHTASEIRSVELSRSDIHILDSESGPEISRTTPSQRTEAFYQPPRGRKTSVWIEWKSYEPSPLQPPSPDPKIHNRVKALAALLKENNRTPQFRAPHCLGYFLDTDPSTSTQTPRFGLVFEKPSTAHPSTRPLSLHTLLTTPATHTPSLTSRIALMRALSETVERLHAVNWLHKGLRSANILFFADAGPDHIDYADMLVSGFDYSRPALNTDMTEKPPQSALEDVYRHPKVQGAGNRDEPVLGLVAGPGVPPSSYKKSYDIYSLGIILLEIAFWAPVDKVLGIQNLGGMKPSTTIRVRQRLLDDQVGVLRRLRSNLGDRIESVVRACLEGPGAFGLEEGVDEREGEGAARLQRGFYERVVAVLGDVRV